MESRKDHVVVVETLAVTLQQPTTTYVILPDVY